MSEVILKPPARFIGRLGINAAVFTVAGFLVSVVAGGAFALGRLRWGAVLVLVAGLCDMLDGAVARVNQKTSSFGAFLDSVVDRYSEAAFLVGLIYYYAPASRLMTVLVAVVLTGSFLVSYAKARAESLGVKCDVGLMERPERMILLAVGYLVGGYGELVAIIILAGFSHVTAFQRMAYTYNQLKKDGGGG